MNNKQIFDKASPICGTLFYAENVIIPTYPHTCVIYLDQHGDVHRCFCGVEIKIKEVEKARDKS